MGHRPATLSAILGGGLAAAHCSRRAVFAPSSEPERYGCDPLMLGIKRGTWDHLLPLPWRTATMLMIPLAPIAIGSDYLPVSPGWWLTGIEKAIPLHYWGVLLIASGLFTLARIRRPLAPMSPSAAPRRRLR